VKETAFTRNMDINIVKAQYGKVAVFELCHIKVGPERGLTAVNI